MTGETKPMLQAPQTPPVRLSFILLMLVGLVALVGAAYLWFNPPAKPVKVEGDAEAVGFSLGLDDKAVARIDRQGAHIFWQKEQRILPNGFAAGMAEIWPDLERQAPDPGLARVKIIPSGGLFPFYRSASFAGEIAAFVRGGGSLICLSQPMGLMYKALPGSPEGVGWAELAMEPREANGPVNVSADHPALAALTKNEINLHYAGFFTKIPGTEQTQVLLRDVETGRPVVIAYRYGQGQVIATTLVSDAAALGTSLSREEKALLDGLLAWATAGQASIPQYNPGDSVEFAYRLPEGKEPAADGFVELYRPDGVLERSFVVELPGEGDGVLGDLEVSEPRGLWRVVSYRRDAGGQAAGAQSISWYASGHPPVAPMERGFHATVALPGYHLVAGGVASVPVYLWNDGDTALEITYRGPAGKRTVRLAPGQSQRPVDEITLDRPEIKPIVYEFYGSDGNRLALVRRRLEIGAPDRVFASLSGDAQVAAGRVATVNLSLLSVNPGTFTADGWARLVHDGEILWQEPLRGLKLYGASSTKMTLKIPLPQNRYGRFVLEVRLTQEQRELVQAWMELNVPEK